ncbi:unnamed protein product [Protopolystoma xenopodis]|uniref:Uncharacterized protein n=1 Tax=Protopolystoma xenopodis TaxID=117903 RepID=A0A448WBR3_9PLAT|nr:unnamed protein product [Protopolystoma xenopodis]
MPQDWQTSRPQDFQHGTKISADPRLAWRRSRDWIGGEDGVCSGGSIDGIPMSYKALLTIFFLVAKASGGRNSVMRMESLKPDFIGSLATGICASVVG